MSPSRPFPDRQPAAGWIRLDPAHPRWPLPWRQLPDPPAAVHLSGCPEALTTAMIAVVGTRRATPRGLAVARGLGRQLAARGWTVVSGLAEGIDGAAHRGALEGDGLSVGVMATGPEQTFPRVHRALRRELEVRGCCLTEYEPGMPPLKHHFPRRNRLIAGLARAVVVVEAPARSGALLTAFQALDYDREVFAVPGPVDLETSRGCHRLLREGAHLLEGVADLERVLGPAPRAPAPPRTAALGQVDPAPGSAARWIFDRLDLEGVGRDALRERWPGNEAAWTEGLLALELAGLIRRLPGGRLARTIWRG